jgi:hypothetical protein
VYSPSTTFAPGEDVAFREISGEAVLLNLETGTYFGLNTVGTRAWMLLVEGRSLGDVRSQLETEFDVSAGALATDLDAWLSALVTKGLVRPACS